MFYGEHLSADESSVACTCGIAATVEIHDNRGIFCGWSCMNCAPKKRAGLQRYETLAKALVRKGRP